MINKGGEEKEKEKERKRARERERERERKRERERESERYKRKKKSETSHYIKLLCNNCPYILKCQNKLIMKKIYLSVLLFRFVVIIKIVNCFELLQLRYRLSIISYIYTCDSSV